MFIMVVYESMHLFHMRHIVIIIPLVLEYLYIFQCIHILNGSYHVIIIARELMGSNNNYWYHRAAVRIEIH